MLTKERKEEILKRNFDGLKPYIQRIFVEAPNLENSVHIEGVALCWKKLQERGMKGDYSWNHSAREYIKLYESLFQEKEPVSIQEKEPNPVVVDIE